MDRPAMLSRIILGAALLCAGPAATSGCEVAAYPADYDGYDYPPPDYVATVEPFYFEGHAAYWYHGRWYYRTGTRWAHYPHEPPGLASHRAQHGPPPRHNYGLPSTTRGGGRPRGGGRR